MSVEVDDEREEVVANRTIRKSGGSYVVSLPPEILEAAGLDPDDDVAVSRSHGSETVEIRADDEGDE